MVAEAAHSSCQAHGVVCERVEQHSHAIEDHEQRLRIVEREQWKRTATMSAFAGTAAALGSLLATLLK